MLKILQKHQCIWCFVFLMCGVFCIANLTEGAVKSRSKSSSKASSKTKSEKDTPPSDAEDDSENEDDDQQMSSEEDNDNDDESEKPGKSNSKGSSKKKEKANGKQPNQLVPDPPDWREIDFIRDDYLPPDPVPLVVDPDETPEGQNQLRKVEERARELYQEWKAVHDRRAPLAGPRDTKVGQILQMRQQNAEAVETIGNLSKEIGILQLQLANASGPLANNLRAEIRLYQMQANALTNGIAANNRQIANLEPQVRVLNAQIAPLDTQLVQIWNQMCQARIQWLDIRRPLEKYVRGEYELLQKVIDDWLLIDGIWPPAHCWAALCAYEMKDMQKAYASVEKAGKLYLSMSPTRRWPQLDALAGMILMETAKTKKTPKDFLGKAFRVAKQDAVKHPEWIDWQTYYILGRCYVNKDSNPQKAKTFLEKSLAVSPNCVCARYWLARLETTTSDEKIRDIEHGTKELEALWTSTGQRSWRMALALSEAYLMGDQKDSSREIVQKAEELAPRTERDKIKAEYEALVERVAKAKEPKPTKVRKTNLRTDR